MNNEATCIYRWYCRTGGKSTVYTAYKQHFCAASLRCTKLDSKVFLDSSHSSEDCITGHSGSKHKPVARPNTYMNSSKLLSEEDLENVSHILPSAYMLSDHAYSWAGMRWYAWWISQQIACAPTVLSPITSSEETTEVAPAFMSVWRELAAYLSQHPGSSIDNTMRHLVGANLISEPVGDEQLKQTKSMIFALIGWQTMLFRSDFGSCPSSHFAITDETDGYRGRGVMKLQHSQSCSREALDKCLLHFGVLLPPKNYDLSSSTEHKQAFDNLKNVDSMTLNAFLLVNVGRFELIWTDSLACHLELDLANSRLFLFRYPSFCVASRATEDEEEKRVNSPLHACAQPRTGSAMWAKSEEVSNLLDEIVMSYRLLFGQDKRSRRLFRNTSPFLGMPAQAHDKVLLDLCERKRCATQLLRLERQDWDLKHDFPILRSRLSTLAYEMSIRKPKTWSQLWNDKRDSAQWATFWIVLIFGFLSLCLSLLQVILQAVQLGQST